MKLRSFLFFAFFLASVFFSSQAYAHSGHDEAPGSDNSADTASITLTESAIKNLGIETVKAEIVPHTEGYDLNAAIEFLPEKQAIVSSRAAGQISTLHVKVGDKISKGQPLLVIQPVSIGSIPVTISAPIAGIVVRQNVVLGQPITTDTSIMELADSSQVLAHGVVYETPEVLKIKAGQNVRVSASLLNDKTYSGVVQRVDTAFEKNTRTFSVYGLIDNQDRSLIGNMQVKLSVEIGASANVLAVPAKAILGDSGDNFVFVKEGNAFERRKVTLGVKFGNLHEILEGVLPDEEVVTVGNYQLQFAKSAAPAKPAKTENHKD